MAEIDLTPTEEMAANAVRGLELRRKHGKGGTEIGVARARDISNRKNLSPETVRRMHAFFSRHEKNKAGGEDDAGYIAWLLWGGDSGRSWAKRKVEQMDKGENQRSDTYKEIAQRLGSAAKHDRPGAKAKMGKDRPLDVTKTSGSSGGTWRKVMTSYGSKKAAVLTFIDNGQVGQVYQDPDNPSVYKAFDMDGTLLGQGSEAEMKRRVEARNFSRPGAKAMMGKYVVSLKSQRTGNTIEFPVTAISEAEAKNYANAVYGDAWKVMSVAVKASRPGAKAKFSNGDKNRRLMQVIADADRRIANQVVSNIAKHYGITTQQVFNEIFDAEAEDLMDYVTEPVRSAAYVILKKKGMMSRPGAKAKFSALDMKTLDFRHKFFTAFGAAIRDAKSNPNTAEAQSDEAVLRESWASMFAQGYADAISDLNGLSAAMKSKASVSQMRKAAADAMEVYRQAKAAVRASRPGAKAKMAHPLTDKFNAYLNESLRVMKARPNDETGPLAGLQNASEMAQRGPFLNEGSISSTVSRAILAFHSGKKDRAVELIREAQRKASALFSRPGAKAKMGMDSEGRRLIPFLQNAMSFASDGDFKMAKRYAKRFVEEATAAGFSRPGAKVANAIREGEKVSASDDAVSRKIRKLMDEGKPQKQAVAIALDLERRGEL